MNSNHPVILEAYLMYLDGGVMKEKGAPWGQTDQFGVGLNQHIFDTKSFD